MGLAPSFVICCGPVGQGCTAGPGPHAAWEGLMAASGRGVETGLRPDCIRRHHRKPVVSRGAHVPSHAVSPVILGGNRDLNLLGS